MDQAEDATVDLRQTRRSPKGGFGDGGRVGRPSSSYFQNEDFLDPQKTVTLA